MCFAVVSPLAHNSGVPLGDHGEEVQVMGYFMSPTLGKNNQFLNQVAKNAMKTMTVAMTGIPIIASFARCST